MTSMTVQAGIERVHDTYLAWRLCCESVDATYRAWTSTRGVETFASYVDALNREAATASDYEAAIVAARRLVGAAVARV